MSKNFLLQDYMVFHDRFLHAGKISDWLHQISFHDMTVSINRELSTLILDRIDQHIPQEHIAHHVARFFYHYLSNYDNRAQNSTTKDDPSHHHRQV